jgi:hypothetical protein
MRRWHGCYVLSYLSSNSQARSVTPTIYEYMLE